MKIIVLNGSPKGDLSITMQYVAYIQKRFPQHEMKIINISQRIKRIEKDDSTFQGIIDEIRSSDAVLWAFPVYLLLVPSQYKRFIELIWERGAHGAFKKKHTAVLTTSIHFFDHTAQDYIRAICDDLEMRFKGAFPAHMRDLMEEEGREKLFLFASTFFEAVEKNAPATKIFKPVIHENLNYTPSPVKDRMDPQGNKVLIVTDSEDSQSNLGRMIQRFKDSFSSPVEVINISEMEIKAHCLGCLHCGFDYVCQYEGKDDFNEVYRKKVQTADILVFAGTIVDHYLSSRWQMFFCRSFFFNHTPSVIGKQIGLIVSGPLSQTHILRQVMEGWVQFQQSHLVDFVSDEYENSATLDLLITDMASRLIRFSEKGYIRPKNFLGVAGMKIFRDEIYRGLRGIFQADHRYYKEQDLYDFPQKDYKKRFKADVMTLFTKIPPIRKEFPRRIKKGMIKPYQKYL
ncbi:MAG: NAD(P)H-dependent oxidoreductase [Thermodesulfobacteriota bacterium]|nr:NAD(P)H-dependent oxidoreductase [Thermodesulfobacteriota bacterium]